MASLLDQLRTLSAVDLAAKLGPFTDCTSNQAGAIAFAELSKLGSDGKPLHGKLISESIQLAHWLFGKQTDATLEELAVELMMVDLSVQIAPYTTGYLHVQTNPKLSYSAQQTVKNAERLVSHFRQLAPGLDTGRVCIKIPATWEGLQACRELEKTGIATLATTLFSLEQTALAAHAGCRYIAPYVNELRVHFDPSYTDASPSLPLCGAAQHYLSSKPGNKTYVLAASLTSVEQVMQLAGIHHITISPPLLAELAATAAATWPGAAEVGQVLKTTKTTTAATATPAPAPGGSGGCGNGASTLGSLPGVYATTTNQLGAETQRMMLEAAVSDEALWRMAFTRAEGGAGEVKLVQAINIFADVQHRLEDMARRADGGVAAGG
ncbi:aldolase [Parathielavia hyrcaniae]|uniref:Transaldolase n=1 Tax=Parathielavia hyrcaniae TaxID=113614 RepID=A0AAN6Q536_9PEZI|nr:aldolase [Parathielavia hyrcaniae]